MNIEKQAQDWVNDGDQGYPVDATGQWMFDKLVEAYKAGYEAASEQLHLHRFVGGSCDHALVDARNKVIESGYLCIKCNAVFRAHDH